MAYTTIDNPELYFQVKLYNGTGSSLSVTLDGDEDMSPNLVWIKRKENASDKPVVYDTVRGVQKRLMTSETSAEDTQAQHVTAFGSDGFTVGTGGAVNTSSETFVAWCWDESATAGFDIVGYTGNSSNRTISHSLSAVPHVIICKNRDDGGNWDTYHHKNTSAPETDYLSLDLTNATADLNTKWNDTAPTSSVFSIGTSANINQNTNNIIAYLWTEKQGFSKFGSYTGNGSSDGPFIYTGFRPAWVMWKISSASGGHWHISDNKRSAYNGQHSVLKANATNAEYTGDAAESIDMLSNGWKPTGSTNNNNNYSGATYVWMAFAEAPFVNSNGVPCNAR